MLNVIKPRTEMLVRFFLIGAINFVHEMQS